MNKLAAQLNWSTADTYSGYKLPDTMLESPTDHDSAVDHSDSEKANKAYTANVNFLRSLSSQKLASLVLAINAS